MKHLWFIFCKGDLMLEKLPNGSFSIPEGNQPPIATKDWTHVLNVSPMDNGDEVKTFLIDEPVTNNPRYEMCGLRKSFYLLPTDLYLKAGKCHELIYWDQNTKYCGVCGFPMKMHTDISKRCPNCGKEVWPTVATAIIVLIHRGDEVLLVHARNFKGNFYGLVAGFVETGETLEEAVHREVMEETGLTITNLRYFGSQPWPYPSGLMVGFTADYVSGDIHLQREELSRGAWFTKDNLPEIPEKLSIARQILDDWLAKA
ncbi:NAD(+) diphosphatase [Prevotella salivae]|uniref:NAD(+) diphosphatase n=1 Tax=Segatella salivae TaxID=228604 RepID=A0AAW4NHQ3_9BACT|nr:NAD(+) diphosphatase [Segatella salivae]MBW4864576.1 NAD(+) diphosphatase [Segatella salivae]MBW4905716.1 NAD(+) diphosphatase [Segatella salivae]MBW4908589.1 NAD(+) diphosphatase [Segatella salivae]